jgi:hypothetical protein
VGGDWKAIVMLAKGSTIAAAPITEPAEPDQNLGSIPLVSRRTAQLADAQLLLMREAHGGSPLIADIAYALFAVTVFAWVLVLAIGAAAIGRHRGSGGSATSTPIREHNVPVLAGRPHVPAKARL